MSILTSIHPCRYELQSPSVWGSVFTFYQSTTVTCNAIWYTALLW